MKVCALVPVHNEERTIGSLVHLIKDKGLTVVVIDDGSSDRSAILAQESGASVIAHPQRMGKGASLRDGFNYALEQGFDGVVTMDGDGQHDTRDLDAFLKAAQKTEAEMVVGNRMTDTGRMPFVRLLTNKFMSFMISLACRQHIPDSQCGYRYVSRSALKSMELATSGFEIETEMLIKAAKKKFRIVSVPIRTIYEMEESKIHPFKDTVRFFKYFFKEIWTPKK